VLQFPQHQHKYEEMMSVKTMSSHLTVRISAADHKEFHKKARKYGKPSELLREIVQAFIQDRLVVQPPVNRKASIYHE
jgi:hypothetical protein